MSVSMKFDESTHDVANAKSHANNNYSVLALPEHKHIRGACVSVLNIVLTSIQTHYDRHFDMAIFRPHILQRKRQLAR